MADSSIITDNDVLVTGTASVIGTRLKDVIDSQQQAIESLKGNVKWIYKYGGVGSGSGSGSSTGKMGLVATLNNNQILQGNVIQLSQNQTSYELKVVASGGGIYVASVSWGDNKSTTFSLTVDNSWTTKYTLTGITADGNINVTLSDGNGNIISVYSTYVIDPYTVDDLSLMDKYGNVYLSQFINIDEAKGDKGLVASSNYKIGIDGIIQYYWIIPDLLKGDSSTGSETNPLSTTEKKSSIKFTLDTSTLTSDNAGSYTVKMKYRMSPTSGTVSDWYTKYMDFYLIPSSLYLVVAPEVADSLYERKDSSFYDIDVEESATIGGINYMVSSETITLLPNYVVYFDSSVSGKKFAFVNYDKTELLTEESEGVIYYRNSTQQNVNVKLCYLGDSPIMDLTYEIINEANLVAYGTNRIIVLYGKIFAGATTGNTGYIYYYLDDSTVPLTVTVTDTQKYNLPNIIFSVPGWHKIHFEYTFPYQGETKSGDPIDRYVYVAEKTSQLNWFYNQSDVVTKNYFRFDNTKTTFSALKNNTTSINYDEKNITDDAVRNIVVDNQPDGDDPYDTFINIGLQYSDSNDDDNPIITFQTSTAGVGYTDVFTLYANKLLYKSASGYNELNLYLHKEDSYDATDASLYHLITINYRFIKQVSDKQGNTHLYRELAVYMDGILEGVLPSWVDSVIQINNIVLQNVNIAVNLLEVDYTTLNPESKSGIITYTPSIVDNNVVYYYYTYLAKSNNEPSLISDEENKIMNIFFSESTKMVNYTVDSSTSLLKIDKSTFDTLTGTWTEVSQRNELPVLVMSTPRHNDTYNIDVITEWMNQRYSESETEGGNDPKNYKIPVQLKWGTIGGGIFDPFASMKYTYNGTEYNLSDVTQFTIKLQGSSTLRYKTKNFTLSLDWASGYTEQDVIPTFSPNYKKDETKTFLPETSFTLKADMVDSAHTNNISIGEFVNDNNKVNNPYKSLSGDADVVNHVRDCLTGFPCILILQTTGSTESEAEYFILGVYNFNLGRESYFNLGYCQPSLLGTPSDCTQNTFTFKTVSNLDIIDTFVCAEIQGNMKYWDFSQYDDTILFTQYGSDSGYYMFDDIVYNTSRNLNYAQYIKAFVEKISKAGGYIFNQIGKSFIEVGTDSSMLPYYHTKNSVPDNTVQYTRSADNSFSKKSETFPRGTDQDLINCIEVTYDESGSVIPEYLLYESALYYYMTCMTFGLVDSVQKNLNIKTWNNKTFGIYFYDMDTCLGIDNDGHFTSYFCFSDYWKTIVSNPQKKVIEGEEVDVYQIDVNNCDIFRDYYPIDASDAGFDIPSSYLYAIPKYAQCIRDFSYLNTSTIWAKWRSVAGGSVSRGPLATANDFITSYYASHLSKVSAVLMNLNYRNKYMAEENDDHTGFNSNTCTALHGKNIERTRDWLTNRLRVLDGYFNLFVHGEGAPVLYQNYYEPKPEGSNINYTSNTDVYVYRDIFNSSNDQAIKRTGLLSFIVKAKDNSPLIILDNVTYKRLFLENSDKYYEITYTYSGSSNSRFGGSPLWTYLDSINSFITTIPSTSKFYLSSDKLTNVSGNSGSSTSEMTIDTVNAKKISLNSSGYSASLSIDSRFKNLNTIDLSNSKISLSLADDEGNDIGVRKLSLRNLGGAGSVVINNTPKLTTDSVDIYNANITSCQILRSWDASIMDLSSALISSLTINANNAGAKFVIKNNNSIITIVANGFSIIEIENCPKLTSVTIATNPTYDSYVSIISITKCSALTTCQIGCKFSTNLKTLNFSECSKLSTLQLDGSENTSYAGVSTLNLYNTALKTINWSNTTSYVSGDICDMRPFVTIKNSSKSLNLSYTPNVEYFLFDNDSSYPSILNTSFIGCTSLKRIYGNVVIKNSSAFRNCVNFSIHGSDLLVDKWKDSSVMGTDGRIKMPFEIISDYESGTTIPKSYDDASQGDRIQKYFQSGTYVTNMYFDLASFSYLFSNTNCTLFDVYYFLSMIPCSSYKTGTYTVSNITKSISACFYMTSSSYGNKKYGRFYWNPDNYDYITDDYYIKAKCDNSPNRYSFVYCKQLTNINDLFRISLESSNYLKYFSYIKLYPPTNTLVDDTRIVTIDDGLFSPLASLSTFSTVFYGRNPYIDRFLFRRLSGNYVISNIRYFNPKAIVDDVNNLTTDPGTTITTSVFGNMENMFTNTPSLTTVFLSFNSLNFINYGYAFKLPKTIKVISNSFNATYATGEIKFDNLFTLNDDGVFDITEIKTSYRVSSDITATSSGLSNSVFYVTDSLLSNFINLEKLGYNNEIGDGYVDNGKDYSSFNGNGIKKLIHSGTTTFPYNVLNNIIDPSTNLKVDKITMFSGLFMNLSFEDQSYTIPELPGNMFTGNTNIEDIGALFWNMKINYKLSDSKGTNVKNFQDCSKLKRCDFVFGSEVLSASSQVAPNLSGKIPYKFFYHGGNQVTVAAIIGFDSSLYDSSTMYHKNDVCRFSELLYKYISTEDSSVSPSEDPTKWSLLKGTGSGDILPSTIAIDTQDGFSYEKVNATIETMRGCFSHSNTEIYINDMSSESYSGVETDNIKRNPNYSKFDYIIDSSTLDSSGFIHYVFHRNVNKDTHMLSYSWAYDGLYEHIPSSCASMCDEPDPIRDDSSAGYTTINAMGEDKMPEQPDGGRNTYYLYYAFPPDLLRYCKDDAIIKELFYGSGSTGWSSQYSNQIKLFDFGMTGRLCPYMFKPVANTTDISYIFGWCRRLSGYATTNSSGIIENAYIIPQKLFSYLTSTQNMDLSYAFCGMVPPMNVDINVIKKMTSKTANVTGMFYRTRWFGNSQNQLQISRIFGNSSGSTDAIYTTSTKYCFACSESITETTSDFPRTQFVEFDHVFKGYNTSAYQDNYNYSYTFNGYKQHDGFVHEITNGVSNATVPVNEILYNYNYYIGG